MVAFSATGHYIVLPAVAAITSVVVITVSRIEVVDANDELVAEGKMLDIAEFDKTIDAFVKTNNDEVVDTDDNVILDDDKVRDRDDVTTDDNILSLVDDTEADVGDITVDNGKLTTTTDAVGSNAAIVDMIGITVVEKSIAKGKGIIYMHT